MNVKLPPLSVLKEHMYKSKGTTSLPAQIMIPSPFDNKPSKGNESNESRESDLEVLHSSHNPIHLLKRLSQSVGVEEEDVVVPRVASPERLKLH